MSIRLRLRFAVNELEAAVMQKSTAATVHWAGVVTELSTKMIADALDDVKWRLVAQEGGQE